MPPPAGGGDWQLLTFLVLHVVAVLLFAKGFFLTRRELSQHSSCVAESKTPGTAWFCVFSLQLYSSSLQVAFSIPPCCCF
jgi:hypothetical protein